MVPITVESEESETFSWETARRAPARGLRGLASEYTGYAERSAVPARRRQLPGTRAVLIVPFGPELEVAPRAGAEFRSYPGGFVAGLHDSFALTRWEGESAGLQVDLTPLAARMVFGLPMSEIAGRVVALDEALGRAGAEFAHAVAEAATWEQRFEVVDAFLVARFAAAPLPARGVVWAWDRLSASGGLVPVGGIARALGWTPRRLIEQFREHVGVAPKAASRLLRFNRLLEMVQGTERPRWAEAAAACGYYDQAHLVRDFVQFSGSTPREYMRRLLPGTGVVD
jgi:AraC-like DNA-binding protein